PERCDIGRKRFGLAYGTEAGIALALDLCVGTLDLTDFRVEDRVEFLRCRAACRGEARYFAKRAFHVRFRIGKIAKLDPAHQQRHHRQAEQSELDDVAAAFVPMETAKRVAEAHHGGPTSTRADSRCSARSSGKPRSDLRR